MPDWGTESSEIDLAEKERADRRVAINRERYKWAGYGDEEYARKAASARLENAMGVFFGAGYTIDIYRLSDLLKGNVARQAQIHTIPQNAPSLMSRLVEEGVSEILFVGTDVPERTDAANDRFNSLNHDTVFVGYDNNSTNIALSANISSTLLPHVDELVGKILEAYQISPTA